VMMRSMLSHPLTTPIDITVPEIYRPYCLMIFQALVSATITNALMDIAFIRHRWRVFLLASRIVGLLAGTFFLSWPQPFLFPFLMWSFNFGFVDPRLHLASIRRSKSHIVFKIMDVFASLLHHTGASLIAACFLYEIAMQRTINNLPLLNIFSLPIFLLIALIVEFVDMVVDVSVLLRTAPRFFNYLAPIMMFIQALCLIGCVLWVETNLPTPWMYALAAGNLLVVFRYGVMGASPSTNEVFKSHLNQNSEDPRDRQSRKSMARIMYNAAPLAKHDIAADLHESMLKGEKSEAIKHEEPKDSHSVSVRDIAEAQHNIESSQFERISFGFLGEYDSEYATDSPDNSERLNQHLYPQNAV